MTVWLKEEIEADPKCGNGRPCLETEEGKLNRYDVGEDEMDGCPIRKARDDFAAAGEGDSPKHKVNDNIPSFLIHPV